jgi:hypothetical protein
MKDNDTDQNRADSSQDATSTSPDTKRTKKNNKTKPSAYKANKDKGKSFCRSWKSASPITKLTVIFAGLAALSALAYVVVAIWQTVEVRLGRLAQHMPLVINSRPPEVLGGFTCDPKQGFRFDAMRTYIKNIGDGRAIDMDSRYYEPKVIPAEHPTGNAFIDAVPQVDCTKKLNPVKDQSRITLAPGEVWRWDIAPLVGTFPQSLTGATLQMFFVSCAYYSDEYGGTHGTCDTYRLQFPNADFTSAFGRTPVFVCDGTTRTGEFFGTPGGHCQQ